jgi:membrane associated rhomboid family serine protease
MFPIRDHNPSHRTPFVTYALIALNVIVFISYLPLLNDEARLIVFFDRWALVPAELVARYDIYTLLTSMFLHGGFMHLAGNMLFLYIFGDNMEAAFGHVKFLAFTWPAVSLRRWCRSSPIPDRWFPWSAPRAPSRVCSAATSCCSRTPGSTWC